MKDTEAIALLKKYKAGNATEEEKAMLESWYLAWNDEDQSFEEEELLVLRKEMWAAVQVSSRTGLFDQPMADQSPLGSVREPSTADQQRSGVRLWPRIAVAAAAVAAITLGTWLYLDVILNRHAGEGRYQDPNAIAISNDIAPGKNGATITLDNGKVIQLNDAKEGIVMDASEISYTDGTNISSSLRDEVKQSQLVMAATSRGQTYQVVLPDGTRVWLNADSKISFPSQFFGRERKVLLTSGEAYFEVAKNKAKPFIVETSMQKIEVLGTHFNINSYANEGATKTTLLEGSVKVSSLLSSPSLRGKRSDEAISKGAAVYLKPNQQSVLSNNNRITVNNIDAEASIAWKNGLFMFDSETLESIMTKVSRWYNVDIIYKDQQVGKQVFSGSVSRFNNVSSVLSKLEKTGPVQFKIAGRTITILSTK